MADPIDQIHDIIQMGDDCALSKIADIIGMTDVEKERDRLARELAAWKRAVGEFGNEPGCAQMWITKRVVELMK